MFQRAKENINDVAFGLLFVDSILGLKLITWAFLSEV